ncbi:MAG: hypothetical protein SFU27_12710 [Thermonemataceae bacterium]|nr:hypothetical protein [Thermonemataceae bacterium]
MKKVNLTLLLCFLMGQQAIAQGVGISNVAFTTPQSPLHIYWTSDGNLLQLGKSSSANTGLIFSVNGSNFSAINNETGGSFLLGTNSTERMRITSGGDVGIGKTPTEKLDISGNVRFSGALMPNNNAGTDGQILISKGAGNPPVWSSPSAVIKTYSVFATRTTINSTSWIAVSGLSQTITTTTPVTLVIFTYGSLEVISSGGNAGCEVKLQQDGVDVPNAFQTIDIADAASTTGTIGLWSFQTVVNIATPGTYTFSILAHKYFSGFDNFYAGGNTTAPVASRNQGALIITEYKQ